MIGLSGSVDADHRTIIRQICLSLRLSVRSHGSLQTRPMCCPGPDGVHYELNLYGRGQIIELNDFVCCSLCLLRQCYATNVASPCDRLCDRVATVPITCSFDCRYPGRGA